MKQCIQVDALLRAVVDGGILNLRWRSRNRNNRFDMATAAAAATVRN